MAGIDTVLVPYVDEIGRDLEEVRAQLSAADKAEGELEPDARRRLEARRVTLEREATLYDAVSFAPPTTLVADSLVIERGGPKIVVLHSGPANTPGDLTVWLPESRVLAVGDIVTRPFPLLGWDTPASWHRSLVSLLERGPLVVLPGHGEVLRSMAYVKLFRDLMGSVSSQVSRGITDGKTLEELQAGVDLAQYWREFADGDERLFDAFVRTFQPVLVERAHLEAVTGPLSPSALPACARFSGLPPPSHHPSFSRAGRTPGIQAQGDEMWLMSTERPASDQVTETDSA